MPRTLPTEQLTHNGETYEVSFEWAVDCKHCGHITSSTSDADRISCGRCNRKNPRDQIVGKYFQERLKYSLFSGEEESINAVVDILDRKAEKYTAMEANGWTFDCTSRSSHVALSKGDVPPQDIRA